MFNIESMLIKNLFFRENQSRLNALIKFHSKMCEYVNFAKENSLEMMQRTNRYLSLNSAKIDKIFYETGIKPYIGYGSQAMGYSERSITLDIPFFTKEAITSNEWGSVSANVLGNIENLYRRSIGIYTDNRIRSLINVINPFEYVRRLSHWLLAPFITIFKTSYDNIVMRVIGIIVQGIILIGTIWPILKELGCSENIVNFIKNL